MRLAVKGAAAYSCLGTALLLAASAAAMRHAVRRAALSCLGAALRLAAFATAMRAAVRRAASSCLGAALMRWTRPGVALLIRGLFPLQNRVWPPEAPSHGAALTPHDYDRFTRRAHWRRGGVTMASRCVPARRNGPRARNALPEWRDAACAAVTHSQAPPSAAPPGTTPRLARTYPHARTPGFRTRRRFSVLEIMCMGGVRRSSPCEQSDTKPDNEVCQSCARAMR